MRWTEALVTGHVDLALRWITVTPGNMEGMARSIGRRIGRRQALGAIGGLGVGAFLAACSGGGGDRSSSGSTSSTTARRGTTTTGAAGSGSADAGLTALFDDAATCSITPEQTEGPFYVDTDQVRRDITEDRDGAPLRLALRVREGSTCTSVSDALVDIWHADAGGVYSGFQSGQGETFLRGVQVTDGDGIVQFATIYPGGYQGRTVHIHAKVHIDNSTALTTQLYFDDDVSDSVLDGSVYGGAGGRTRNSDDDIYDEQTELTLTPEGDGYLGVLTFDVRS
jgi:protocatechuate 3,4-dioxygenase beta subunit